MARSSTLPPGFRFHPTDVELVMYYLKRKILGKKLFEAISEVNIYKFSPWDLPDKSCLRSKDREWFFFCPIERKYPNGGRTKRATETGYWKATGKDRNVLHNEKNVGMVRTLIFYTGHAPKGNRTDWVMHEYKMEDKDMANAGVQDAFVLCKVFEKSGPGPKNGAQYGAPFNEEEWDEDEETCAELSPVDGLAPPVLTLPNFQNSSYVTSMIDPGGASSWFLSEPGPSTVDGLAPPVLTLPNFQNSSYVTSMIDPGGASSWFLSEPGPSTAGPSFTEVPKGDDDVASLLDMFIEDATLLPTLNGNDEMLKHTNCDNNMEEYGIFDGLGDLSEGGYNFSSIDKAFLELNDLDAPLEHPIDESSGPELLSTDASIVDRHVNLDHIYRGGTFSGSIQNYSGLNQSLDQSNYPGNHFHVL